MIDANTFGVVLIAAAVGAFVLRLVAVRKPELRAWANIAALVLLAILVGLIALLLSSVVGAYVGGLPD